MAKHKVRPDEMGEFTEPAELDRDGPEERGVIPAPKQTVLARHNMEMARIEATLEEMIEAHGGIPEGDQSEMLLASLKTSLGIDEAQRNGFRGVAVAYAVFAGIAVNPGTGEIGPCPFLALLTRLTGIVRLSGYSAVSTWAGILRAVGEDRLRAGIPIVVRKRASSTVGRSYWVVEIDAPHEIGE